MTSYPTIRNRRAAIRRSNRRSFWRSEANQMMVILPIVALVALPLGCYLASLLMQAGF